MTRQLFGLVLLTAVVAQARGNTANFDALTTGATYASGSQFSNGGIDFNVLYGATPLQVVAATSPINPSFSGNYIDLTSNVALNVNLPTGASQIQFDFILDTPAVAFDINGTFLTYDDIPTTVNGVTVTQSLGSKTTPWGYIRASGGISSFIIVGNNFSVDNFSATLLPGLPGDYNKNLEVDAADYVIWRKSINIESAYNSWRSNFGMAAGVGSGTNFPVPEPSLLAISLCGLPGFVCIYRRRSSPRRMYARTHTIGGWLGHKS